ncbi:DUF4136 domain-containing protein [Agaribacterium haliotis]|uniref:DUF4136 domain-containing protein n=1 Tax=Agaribacterium haliotis TaxID=2013869 RepID=UPI0013042BC0|nr:DUF4136 domain-containing protein [Agaribacterium haliotis]
MTLVLLVACTTNPVVQTQSSPGLDMSRYQTFGFFSPLSTDQNGYSSLVTQTLKDATRSALEAKGYVYQEQNPSMLVNFTTTTKEKMNVDSEPAMMPIFPLRAGLYGPWGGYGDIDVNQYEDGTLLVDLVDASKKQMIWQGTASSIVESSPEANSKHLRSAISDMMAKLPEA